MTFFPVVPLQQVCERLRRMAVDLLLAHRVDIGAGVIWTDSSKK